MIRILTFESKKEKWFQILSEKYEKKIQPFYPFERLVVKNPSSPKEAKSERLKKEAKTLLKHSKNHYKVLCDETGTSLSSTDFSKLLQERIETGDKKIDFIIGGAFGVDEQIKEEAETTISLSPFVLNHLIAQALLMEQIYRAFSILKGLPYHND